MTEDIESRLGLYKWREADIPQGLEHFALAAFTPEPEGIRCKVHIGEYPDPDGFIWALNRLNLQLCDPGCFQAGAIKDKLIEARALNLKWRQENLVAFCKLRELDLSIFPPFPEGTKNPKFSKFGPKHATIIDKFKIELGNVYPLLLFVVISELLIISLRTKRS